MTDPSPQGVWEVKRVQTEGSRLNKALIFNHLLEKMALKGSLLNLQSILSQDGAKIPEGLAKLAHRAESNEVNLNGDKLCKSQWPNTRGCLTQHK